MIDEDLQEDLFDLRLVNMQEEFGDDIAYQIGAIMDYFTDQY